MKYLGLFLLPFFLSIPVHAALRVHEWGTFTSVQGSDGVPLSGLEYEEEALPPFVHSLDAGIEDEILNPKSKPSRCEHKCKGFCCDDLTPLGGGPAQVTQKMETPVLYFYSPEATRVDVTVDFPKGIISQYYPQPTRVTPFTGGAQVLANGQMRYSGLEILGGPAEVPAVLSGNVYAPARETRSNFVRSAGETEKFVFYRGLGDFLTSLKVTSSSDTLSLTDTRGRGIPYLIALNVRGGKAAFKELGSLTASQTRTLDLKALMEQLAPTQALEEFEARAGSALVAALRDSGLYDEEARSMVNTWKRSYFNTEGLRVLYVLPRAETDELLPITIVPRPSELVRTLVGRVEVLTQPEEVRLMAELDKPAPRGLGGLSGRFREPKLRRIRQLVGRP